MVLTAQTTTPNLEGIWGLTEVNWGIQGIQYGDGQLLYPGALFVRVALAS